MPTFNRSHTVKPWDGTTDDLLKIVSEVRGLVDTATSGNSYFRITVDRPGREDSYESLEEFDEGLGIDLRSIETVAIHASDKAYPEQVRVATYLYCRHRGAVATVQGTNQVSVNGIAAAIEEQLNAGRRRARWLSKLAWPFYGLGLVLVLAGLAGIALEAGDADETLTGILTWAGVGIMLASAVVFVTAWRVVPPVELRRPGEQTRLRALVGRPLLYVGGVLFVAVVGLGVQQLLT